MFQFTIILLITCLELNRGFAYQCPKSISFCQIPGLSRVNLPVSNALNHFRTENELLIDSNGRTRYVCEEITPEIYTLRNKTTNYDNDLQVQTGGDYKSRIIPNFLGGSNDFLNIFPPNHNCKSELLNCNIEPKLAELLTKHSRITYMAEFEYALMTDTRPTNITAVYMDENKNNLGSLEIINSPPNTFCRCVTIENHTKSKRSLTESSTHLQNSTHPKNSTRSTKNKNCMNGCRRTGCWEKVEDRDKHCRSHFHSVHNNALCVDEWCYCCSYY